MRIWACRHLSSDWSWAKRSRATFWSQSILLFRVLACKCRREWWPLSHKLVRMESHPSECVCLSDKPIAFRVGSLPTCPLLYLASCTDYREWCDCWYQPGRSLRIVWGGESVGDLVFGTEAYHLFAGKVRPVVGDDGIRYHVSWIRCQV